MCSEDIHALPIPCFQSPPPLLHLGASLLHLTHRGCALTNGTLEELQGTTNERNHATFVFLFYLFLFFFWIFWLLEMGLAIQPWLAWACDPSPASASAMISLQVSCGWLDLPDWLTQDDALQSRLLPWRKQNSTLLYGWRSRTVCTYHNLFMCSATDGNPGWFQNMALVRRRHPCGVWPYSPFGACLPAGSQVLCSFCLCFTEDPSWWFLQWLHQLHSHQQLQGSLPPCHHC